MKIKAIYDNGGKSVDRYTVVYDALSTVGRTDLFESLGMSDNPTHPQGIGQHSACLPGAHLGKRIEFSDLPADCQAVVEEELAR